MQPFTWILLFVLLSLAVVLVVAAGRARRARRRLGELVEMAAGIEHGDFGVRADESGGGPVARLGTAMNRMALRTERVVGDLEARDRSMHFLSNHDALTGLPNRRLFEELLRKDLVHSRRDQNRVAVLMVDLDRFRSCNDSFGTAFGDRLLVAVADRIVSLLRETDLVARLGGDEFALALTKASSVEDLMFAANRVGEGLRAPFEIDGQEVRISASLGAGLFPDGGDNSDELLSHAGEALRRAKEQGGDTLKVFDPDRSWARAQLRLEEDLRRAIHEGGFDVHYQPQVAMDNGRILGLEALVRWPHAGVELPDARALIPLAEATGLMPALGSWLIDEICRQIAAWEGAGVASRPVSVNVSARQFQAGNMVEVIEYALTRHGLVADRLQIEITESLAMNDLERVNEGLTRLREHGVKVLLDDFGTGFSSLSFLLKHPIDGLKIDRSFVAGIELSDHSESVIRAAIALARSLDLSLIAEGVETPEQFMFLRRHGCVAAQGFLLSRPLPPPEVQGLLRRGAVELQTGWSR